MGGGEQAEEVGGGHLISGNPRQSEATRGNPRQPEATRGNPRQSEATGLSHGPLHLILELLPPLGHARREASEGLGNGFLRGELLGSQPAQSEAIIGNQRQSEEITGELFGSQSAQH